MQNSSPVISSSDTNALKAFIDAIQLLPSQKTDYHFELFKQYLSTYDTINHLVSLNEAQQDIETNKGFKIKRDFAALLKYKSYEPNSFIHRNNEESTSCYFLINGTVIDLIVKFKKQMISCEEYLTHLIKLKLLNENGLYDHCIQSNKHIKETNFEAIGKISEKKYKVLEAKANDHVFNSKETYKNNESNNFITSYINKTKLLKERDSVDSGFKKAYIIPYYEISSQLPRGSFLGDVFLNAQANQMGSFSFHTYISITRSDIGAIDLQSSPQSRFVNEIRKALTKVALKNTYYLFQNIDKEKFINFYSNQFSYIVVHKGDKFILQDTYAHGIFMSNVGSFEISTVKPCNELDSLIRILQSSLLGYKEINVSSLENDSDNTHKTDRKVISLHSNLQLLEEEKKIKLNHVTAKEIFGLNEFYDYKTNLYHFTVECTSEIGGLFYLPREAFWTLFNKENSVLNYLLTLIENKVMYYIATINRFKEVINKAIGMNPKKDMTPSSPHSNSYSFQRFMTESNTQQKSPAKLMFKKDILNKNVVKLKDSNNKLIYSPLMTDINDSNKVNEIMNQKSNNNLRYKQLNYAPRSLFSSSVLSSGMIKKKASFDLSKNSSAITSPSPPNKKQSLKLIKTSLMKK